MKCECIYEPRGDHGIEGFCLGCQYKLEKYERNGKPMFKVWCEGDFYGYGLSLAKFKKYFKEVEMKVEKTGRGFEIVKFSDCEVVVCSWDEEGMIMGEES